MREVDTREISGAAVNVIAQGTQLQGNMVTVSDCRIDGILRGNIESKAKIIVGRSGSVEGNIKCVNIEIDRAEGHRQPDRQHRDRQNRHRARC